jgi:hypothetical protein
MVFENKNNLLKLSRFVSIDKLVFFKTDVGFGQISGGLSLQTGTTVLSS